LFNTDKDDTDKTKIATDADYIVFADDKTDEYEKLIATPASKTKDEIPGFVDFNEVVEKKVDDDDIIDIDDI
jgi:heme-degrading monooxygenase HmoA